VEATVNATEVITCSLSEKVMLLVEEHLVLCPDIEKYYEATTMRRIPTGRMAAANLVSTYYSAPDKTSELIEAEHILPLHTIDVFLNGKASAIGILDRGCQIVIIQKDIWK